MSGFDNMVDAAAVARAIGDPVCELSNPGGGGSPGGGRPVIPKHTS